MHHPCCFRSSLDPETSFCAECGGPILRCAAFEECGGLVDTDGLCRVCVAPELFLDGGAVESGTVGGALALPLVVRNGSTVGRPLMLRGLWSREGGQDWREVELAWDRLPAGASAPVPLRVAALDRAGTHRVEILVAVASRWRWREEVAAFSAVLELGVEGGESITVQQNITYGADAPQTGATIYAPLRVDGARGGAAAAAERPRELELVRATRLERSFGLRAGRDGVAVPRAVRVRWRGFPEGVAPSDGPIAAAGGLLSIGRARARAAGGPNDVRLLARQAGGSVDEERSLAISRCHLGLYVENDRLMLRVESERGVSVNSEMHRRGAVIALMDGDTFSPLRGEPAGATVRVRFDTHHDVVHAVELCAQ